MKAQSDHKLVQNPNDSFFCRFIFIKKKKKKSLEEIIAGNGKSINETVSRSKV